MRSALFATLLFAQLARGGDALDLPPAPSELTNKRLDFKSGSPIIPVRLMEGSTEVTLVGRGRLRFRLPGTPERLVEGPPGMAWKIKRVSGTPASIVARIQIVEIPFADKLGLAQAQEEWSSRGLRLKSQILGGVYGIAGKVIDNRRYVLVVDQPPAPPESLAAQQADILKKFSVRTSLLEDVKVKGTIKFELVDGTGNVTATVDGQLTAESPDGAPIEVKRVEFGVGYDFHNFEDRAFRGSVLLTADRFGKIAVVNQVDLEDLLKGLVPSEIFAKAHAEALKAQAVTARGEVLAKIGLKHLADPYLLCTEQHCAVYRGVSGEAATTNAAVEATRGEASFDANDRLVDSVYSAVCGGHSENNEIVWGGVANASLRGRPDIMPGKPTPASPKELSRFLSTEAQHACKVSSFAALSKYRWEKRFTAKDVDDKLASFAVGKVMAMNVTERGVSGRARLLQISGEEGATTIRGELNIRRTFGMLNSAMFELKAEKDAKGRPVTWIFTGGGWGHGVGMCQTGAIGRAEAGQTYRQILDHYFNGAQVARIY
ncbi:MAG: SpoIID/LytB domain-containing protein [Archangium sp.]|nr:SpoIID/LytB domain-containing protein [Archangium sp.]MDP3155412.1 SpoIID/LytB domain-containing protein [Archangium sp.]MDP3573744.1 SpoIID/LytB domain-containing protein [Archangium sp.]